MPRQGLAQGLWGTIAARWGIGQGYGAQARRRYAVPMPPPTARDDWIAAFITVLVCDAKPSRGRKFATMIANREWRDHQNEKAREAAFRWLQRQAR